MLCLRMWPQTLLALMLLGARAGAFSLLGPCADWMQLTNGYRQFGDIGGPMNLGEEHRWNVPVLTYGFDPSFLDYFGSNGVAAVEQAFQILNDLPPASAILLTNYPLDSRRVNWVANQQRLSDLKSITLTLLLEQLGLAEPTRHVFILRRWHPLFLDYPWEPDWPGGIIPYWIDERNFDPETLVPSHCVNATLYGGYAICSDGRADVFEYPVDPLASTYTAVAEMGL